MEKIKSTLFAITLMLLLLAVTSGGLSIKYLFEVRSADRYEDKGVYTFVPYQVLPVQVKNTGSGRNRRMNPTKTVYMVYYREASGSGYQWSEQAYSRDLGQDIVDAGKAVERRVLSIVENRTYITVEPDENAESYTAGLRQRYIFIIALSAAYILLYAAVCLIRARIGD